MPRKAQANRNDKDAAKKRHDGHPSVFTCPDCQGTLFILNDGRLIRFRCRIGHMYSPESMMEAQDDNVERLMWSATRALEEQAEYSNQLADQIGKASARRAKAYVDKGRSALAKADVIRGLFTQENGRSQRTATRPDRD